MIIKVNEITENEFIHYQSHMIGNVESVTIEEGRECEGKKEQEQTNTKLRRSRRARKRANFDEFMHYDD